MPQTSTFLDSVDERAIVSFILSTGGRLVADRQSAVNYPEITTIGEYLAARTDNRLFFVLYDCFSQFPLVTRQIIGGFADGSYYIAPRVGGPTIQFITSVEVEKAGVPQITDGSIGYYPSYEDPRTAEMQNAPDLLKLQYKAIIKEVKKGSKMIRARWRRTYVIGRHAYESIKQGKLRLGVEGLSPD